MELLSAILERPETWGGIALASSFGWWTAEKRNEKMASLFSEMMHKFANSIMGDKQP